MTVVELPGNVRLGQGQPLALIAGPCVLEDERLVMETAEHLVRLAAALQLPFVFKASFEKDNRSTLDAYRGPGLKDGLALLARVRRATGALLLSDVHREPDLAPAAEVLDIVQIPAFLCRQTSLLLEAGRRCPVVNLKKGQFAAPEDMVAAVEKVRAGGPAQILLTERGSSFGYNRLVVDLTSIPILQATGWPVVLDASHSLRAPGNGGRETSARARVMSLLARAGAAAGCDALFIETHPEPGKALCDGALMLPLEELRPLLESVLPIARVVRELSDR